MREQKQILWKKKKVWQKVKEGEKIEEERNYGGVESKKAKDQKESKTARRWEQHVIV